MHFAHYYESLSKNTLNIFNQKSYNYKEINIIFNLKNDFF